MDCGVDQYAIDYSDKLTDIYATGIKRLANNLLYGTLSLDDWQTNMQDAIRKMYGYQAIAGVGGDQSKMSDADWTRVEANVQSQFEYLEGFADKILNAVEEDGASLNFISNQASLYAMSSKAEFWRQATNGEDLPAQPCDGTSECLGKCGCKWECRNGKWHWVRGKDDSCDTCIQREKDWSPYEPDEEEKAA